MEEEIFNIVTIFKYVKDNFIGLCLLIFVFFIIYFVDYINTLNSLIFSTTLPFQGIANNTIIKNGISNTINNIPKTKKNKKH